MNSIMKKVSATLALTGLMVIGSVTTAHAVPVTISNGEIQYAPGSSTVATGILGMDVGGTLWDVDFTGAFTHNEWAGMLNVTTLGEATDIIQAIGDAFDDAGVTLAQHDFSGGSTFDHNVVSIWYGTNATSLLGVAINAGGGWGTFVGNSNAPLNNSSPLTTILTPSAVPVPAAAWLLGSALFSLGWVKRKKA